LDLACGKSGELAPQGHLSLRSGTCGNKEIISTCAESVSEEVLLGCQDNFKPLEYKALYYGTQSDILALEESTEEDFKAINYGLAMHYMLEMLGEFKVQNIPHAKDMMLNKYGTLLEEEEVEDIQKRVTMLLNSKEFMELVDGKCYREKAIRHKNNLRYIDLLVQKDVPKEPLSLFSCGMWNVLDYKSSNAYAEHHIKQVNYYVKAIEAITSDEVKGYICYLLENEVKIVQL